MPQNAFTASHTRDLRNRLLGLVALSAPTLWTACAVDDRQVSVLGEASQTAGMGTSNAAPAGSEQPAASAATPGNALSQVATCEGENCLQDLATAEQMGGNAALTNSAPETEKPPAATSMVEPSRDSALGGAQLDAGAPDAEAASPPPIEPTPPPQCPPANVCQQFDENCNAVFTPAARGGAACQCDAAGCSLREGEPCANAGQCASGACAASESGFAVCCASSCAAGDLCTADGTSCVTPTTEQGGRCLQDDDCETNFCADGVCCNESCDGVCETCADTGVCRGQFDDNACPFVRCSQLDNTCTESTTDITTDRCAAKGACKTEAACGLAPARSECPLGFCDGAGACQAPNVSCGGDCETGGVGGGRVCCSRTPQVNNVELLCTDERDCDDTFGFRAFCDEANDCRDGEVCCHVSSPATTEIFCAPAAECVREVGVRATVNVVCDAPAAEQSPCPEGDSCVLNTPLQHFPGWSFCQLQ